VARHRTEPGLAEYRLSDGHADNIHHLDRGIALGSSRRQPEHKTLEMDVKKVEFWYYLSSHIFIDTRALLRYPVSINNIILF